MIHDENISSLKIRMNDLNDENIRSHSLFIVKMS